jgi:hypothetical protein
MSTERDRIRAELLKSRPVKSKVIEFFGQQIEIKQLTLGAVINARTELEDQQGALISILLKYAYVPGTEELLFEDTDADSLKALPFGGDFVSLTNAITELTNLTFPTPGGDSKSTESSPGPTGSRMN